MTKQEAINFINNLPEDLDINISTSECYVSCSEVEKLGISRQLLKYHVDQGEIKTIKANKYNKYLLEDVLKLK